MNAAGKTLVEIVLVGVVLLVALAVRMAHLGDASMWYDESFSYLLTQKLSWGEMFHALRNDVHAPLYFVLLRLWGNLFGESIVTLRTFSVVSGVMTVGGVYLLTRDLFRTPADDPRKREFYALGSGGFSALLLALASSHVRWSQDAKMYSLGTAFVVWGVWCLVRALQAEDHRAKHWLAAWALFRTASLYTHNYAIFTFAAECVVLAVLLLFQSGFRPAELLANRRSRWVGFAVLSIIVAYSLWVPTLLNQVRRVKADYWISKVDGWSIPYCLDELMFPSVNSSLQRGRSLIVVAVICLLCVWLIRQRKWTEWLLMSLILMPIFLATTFSVAFASIATPRYFLFATVFLPVAASLFLWRSFPFDICLGASVLLIANVGYLHWKFVESHQYASSQGTRGAAEFAIEKLKEGETLLVTNTGIYSSVQYYTQGKTVPVLLRSEEDLPHYLGGPVIGTMKEVRTWELDGTPLNELWVISSTAFAIVPEAHARLSNEWSQDPDSSRVFKEIYDWQGFVTVERYTRSVPTDADDQHLGHLSRLEAR